MNSCRDISAGKKHWRKRKDGKRTGSENIIWHRITENLDDLVKRLGANPDIGSPLTRLVLFRHLTKSQGKAGRWYAESMREFEHYHVDIASRTPRSQRYERSHGGQDHELESHIINGSAPEYIRRARQAMKRYIKIITFLNKYPGAKEALDSLCLLEIEPPAEQRKSIAIVLDALSAEIISRSTR